MKLLAFAGFKFSGKDSACNFLMKEGLMDEKYSFAKPLKDTAKIIFGWDEEHVNGKLKDVVDSYWGISPRQFLQNFGTNYMQFSLGKRYPQFEKTVGRNTWVRRFEKYYLENKDKNICISDLRFLHEENKIKELGGKTVCIKRFNSTEDIHPSEISVLELNPDFEIINPQGDLDYLRERVIEIYRLI